MTLEMLRKWEYQRGYDDGYAEGLKIGKEELLQEPNLSYSKDFDDLTISSTLNITQKTRENTKKGKK